MIFGVYLHVADDASISQRTGAQSGTSSWRRSTAFDLSGIPRGAFVG